MGSFRVPIQTGLIIFPFLALFITFPYMLRQYHKFGAVSKLRVLVVYSFILYMLIAYFMVILPLPDPATTVGNRWQDHLQTQPFHYIIRYFDREGWSLHTLRRFLPSWDFLQLAYNVLLTLPFGVYLRYYFKRSWLTTVLLSLALSLLYETTQLSALYGIYPGPYRLADVDDLICNTLGGLCGYLVAPMFVFFLPTRDAMDKSNFTVGIKVTGMRRLWALLVDLFLFFLLYATGFFITYTNRWETANHLWLEPWCFWGLFLLLGWLSCLLFHGKTPGKALCRMQIIGTDNHPASAGALTLRYATLFFYMVVPNLLFTATGLLPVSENDHRMETLRFLLGLFCMIWYYSFLLRYLWRISFGKKLLPHVKRSHTKHISTLHEHPL